MKINIPEDAVREEFVRSSGPGGQNVNKVATNVVLRLDTTRLDLASDTLKRLAHLAGRRLTDEGILILRSQQFRTQERNRRAARETLHELLAQAHIKPKPRKATKASYSSHVKRLDTKKRRSDIKSLRRNLDN